jgi:hypothetical protein
MDHLRQSPMQQPTMRFQHVAVRSSAALVFFTSMTLFFVQTLDGTLQWAPLSSIPSNVPVHVPIHQYWSMTVYNRDTHAFIRNARWVGRSSQTPAIP